MKWELITVPRLAEPDVLVGGTRQARIICHAGRTICKKSFQLIYRNFASGLSTHYNGTYLLEFTRGIKN